MRGVLTLMCPAMRRGCLPLRHPRRRRHCGRCVGEPACPRGRIRRSGWNSLGILGALRTRNWRGQAERVSAAVSGGCRKKSRLFKTLETLLAMTSARLWHLVPYVDPLFAPKSVCGRCPDRELWRPEPFPVGALASMNSAADVLIVATTRMKAFCQRPESRANRTGHERLRIVTLT